MLSRIRFWLGNLLEYTPRFALFVRSFRDLLDRDSPPIHTPWGFTLAGNPMMAAGEFEPSETTVVRQLLLDVEVLVNVGANVGYYCSHALSLGKQVIAIEPVQRNLDYLLKNISNNEWGDQAEVYPVALGDRSGVATIWGGNTGASLVRGWAKIPESYCYSVPMLTLNRVLGANLEGKPSLVIIDVEGFEYEVLKGASHILTMSPKPIWMIEVTTAENRQDVNEGYKKFKETFKLMLDSGYRACAVNDLELELSLDDVEAYANAVGKPNGYNFLFYEKLPARSGS